LCGHVHSWSGGQALGQPHAVPRWPLIPHRLWLHLGQRPQALPTTHEDLQGACMCAWMRECMCVQSARCKCMCNLQGVSMCNLQGKNVCAVCKACVRAICMAHARSSHECMHKWMRGCVCLCMCLDACVCVCVWMLPVHTCGAMYLGRLCCFD